MDIRLVETYGQNLGGVRDPAELEADIFFGGCADHFPEDPVKIIGRKPNTSRQNIQSQVVKVGIIGLGLLSSLLRTDFILSLVHL